VACCQAYAGNSRRDESTILEEPVYPSHVPMDTFYHYRVIPKGQWTLEELDDQASIRTAASMDSAEKLWRG
jgi:hypothetical protein